MCTFITKAFITYDETTYDKDAAREQLSKAGGSNIKSLDKMYENSRDYLHEELLKLLPIVIVLTILVLVSGVSISKTTGRPHTDNAEQFVSSEKPSSKRIPEMVKKTEFCFQRNFASTANIICLHRLYIPIDLNLKTLFQGIYGKTEKEFDN